MIFPITAHRALVMLSACVATAGCSGLSGLGGSSEYGCAAPEGVRCESVSGNYYSVTRNALPVQRERREAQPDPRIAGVRRDVAAAPPHPTAEKAGADIPASWRAQARVLRLWFKPWEDADRDLYDAGFVYVQIDQGRWLIDHVQPRPGDAFPAILPPRQAASSLTEPTRPATSGSSTSGTSGNSASLPAAPRPLRSAPPRADLDNQ